MKKFLFSILLVVGLFPPLNAQTTDTVKHFRYGGFSSFTFNQVKLSNWSAGGQNAFSATASLNLFGNYAKANINWDNTLNLGYGLVKNGSTKMQKSDDNIELSSKLGYHAFGKVYYSVLLDFLSQFSKGFNYPNDSVPVSKFMSPGYLSVGLGLDYKPSGIFSVYLSPATGKFIFVTNQVLANTGAFGVDSAVFQNGVVILKGKKVRPEFGASLSTQIQMRILKNVNLISKLVLFNNYTDANRANRKNIDVNWNVMININAGNFLTTSITTNLIYDHNVIAKTQFKESLGVGLSYQF